MDRNRRSAFGCADMALRHESPFRPVACNRVSRVLHIAFLVHSHCAAGVEFPWRATVAVIAATLGLSVPLAVADYRFVNSYPAWVAQNIAALQQQGFRIWNASESGLRFYVEQRRIETLDNSDNRPRGGDLVLR